MKDKKEKFKFEDWEYFSKALYLRFLEFKIMIEIKKDENVTNNLRTNNKNTEFIMIENKRKIIMNVIWNSNIIKRFSVIFKYRIQ